MLVVCKRAFFASLVVFFGAIASAAIYAECTETPCPSGYICCPDCGCCISVDALD